VNILAAVTHRRGEEFKIERVMLSEPKADEVLVRIIASGICQSDIHVQHQEYFFPLPAVLGHEGAGIVEKVGKNVYDVQPGDHVVLGYSYCGECEACREGKPFQCRRYYELNFGGKLADGTSRIRQHGRDLAMFFGQSSFAEMTVVNVNNVVKIDPSFDLRLAAALACGIPTGFGTVSHQLQPVEDSRVAVFGTGAVGLGAIMAAKLRNCKVIVAVDTVDHRLALAKKLGATHFIRAHLADPVEILMRTFEGVDFAIEASGLASVGRQAFRSLAVNGKLAYVGEFPQLSVADIEEIRKNHLTVAEIVEGNNVLKTVVPYLIDLYRQGKFPFEKLVRYYPWEEINQAVADSVSGLTIKPILVMP